MYKFKQCPYVIIKIIIPSYSQNNTEGSVKAADRFLEAVTMLFCTFMNYGLFPPKAGILVLFTALNKIYCSCFKKSGFSPSYDNKSIFKLF